MRIITTQDRADTAAERWNERYSDQPWKEDARKQRIAHKLESLENPTPEKINEIIGNPTWTSVSCENCEKDVNRAVVLSTDDDYNNSATYCFECIAEAYKMLEAK